MGDDDRRAHDRDRDRDRNGARHRKRRKKRDHREDRDDRERHHAAGGDEDPDFALLDEAELAGLPNAEREYRLARDRAEKKLRLAKKAVKDGIFVALLLIFIWPVGVIVGVLSAMKLGRRYYELFVEPNLRRKWVEREVTKRVDSSVLHERQELRSEHARSMEQLSASIAHEIRNPITAAKSLVQQMGEDPSQREHVEYAKVALEELDRVERSISHLLRFAREEDLVLTPMSMRDVVESAMESLRDRFETLGVELGCEIDSEGEMRGDPEKLRRVVLNLMSNALDALEQHGVAGPRLELAIGENLAGTEVWLRVKDNGPGIDPERLQKIFSPFYTEKRNGTGLGLAISKKLVDAHGGVIEAHSSPGSGTEFVLTFPKQPERAQEAGSGEEVEAG